MLCIHNTHTDAWFNLAAEEYLLKNFSEDIFMLWQNEPAVVIGKYQNIRAEMDIEYARQKRIRLARRYSGGGAVYHDMGNLNLTFIENSNQIRSSVFTESIIRFLKHYGLHARSDERQGLTIDGLKISGSAQAIHKRRMLPFLHRFGDTRPGPPAFSRIYRRGSYGTSLLRSISKKPGNQPGGQAACFRFHRRIQTVFIRLFLQRKHLQRTIRIHLPRPGRNPVVKE